MEYSRIQGADGGQLASRRCAHGSVPCHLAGPPGSPVSSGPPAECGPSTLLRDGCQSIPQVAGTQRLLACLRENAAGPIPGFPVGCGEQWSPATGNTGKMGQNPEKLPRSGALGTRHFRSITATWVCLALKARKLHLKALKSLLSPCLIALKAFKPSLQDSKPMGAKPLALVGLQVLPAGTVGTRLPCLGGRDEQAAASTSGGDRGDRPLTPRGTVCPHLMAQGILQPSSASKWT